MNIQMVSGKFYDNTYSAVWGPQNEYWGVIAVSQEVTERKKAEDDLREALKKLKRANQELKYLDQMKADFFSNVSHELKTPMISVMGYVGMLLNGKVGGLTEQQKKFLEISYKNLLKLGKNIDNLFDLAELGIQKEGWAFDSIDLSEIIEFSCSTIEPLAREHQITLEMQLLRILSSFGARKTNSISFLTTFSPTPSNITVREERSMSTSIRMRISPIPASWIRGSVSPTNP